MTERTLAEWIGDDNEARLHISEAFMALDTESKVVSLITMAGAALAYVIKINEVYDVPPEHFQDRRSELVSVAIIEGLRVCDHVTDTAEIDEKGVR